MNFCGNCGARVTATAYCTNCGQALTTPGAGQQPTAPASAQPGGGAPPTGAPPGAGQPGGVQAGVARPNPFAAIPVGDYVRDLLAVLFLLVPLGMAWDLADDATGKVYVILVTLLSVVSLALPYLRAVSVLPPTLAPPQLRLVRLLANAPYIIVVLVTLVLGYLGEGQGGPVETGDGVGVGLVIGLVGALLAAQARASEQGPGSEDGVLWRLITVSLAGLAVVLGILTAIIVVIDMGENLEWSELAALLVAVVFFVGIPAVAAFGVFRGDAAWRDAAMVVGLVGLLAAFWALGAEETVREAWSLRLQSPRFLFWPAIGAAAAAVGVAAVVHVLPGARRWVMLPVRLFETAAGIATLSVLYFAFRLVEQEEARGALITVLVFSLIALAAAFVGRNALIGNVGAGRPAAMGVAGAFVVIGIVQAAVLGSAESTVIDAMMATVISAWFVFAVVIALALTAPKSVRNELGNFQIGQPGAAATGTAAGSPAGHAHAPAQAQQSSSQADRQPQPYVPPRSAGEENDPASTSVLPATDSNPEQSAEDPAMAEEPTDVPVTDEAGPAHAGDATKPSSPMPAEPTASGYTEEIAADPNTPLQTLADIAAKEPSLRPAIALNPSTYPELLDWLGQLRDPAVDEALRRRAS